MAWHPSSLPLLARYPELRDAHPRYPILQGSSPVQRLRQLEERVEVKAPLWIKRDDLLGTVYGGNKPRKLEFLLGNLVARRRRSVVTVGGLGSNHCLATAIYGGEAGLEVHACLLEQPLTRETEDTLARMASLGATLHFATSGLGVRARILTLLARETAGWPPRPPGLILPGGSVPLGTLGIVNAALELGEQVESGIAPRPAAIFVALGSGGTHAGLAAGLHLLGWGIPVIGVRVSDRLRLDRATVAKLAERTLDLLRRADPSGSIPALAPGAVVVREGFLGEGYGHPTEAGDRAGRLLQETEGLFIDRTYTGKAMAAMLDAARGGQVDGPLLFWNTFNSRPLPAPDPRWRDRLPTSLRRHLEARP